MQQIDVVSIDLQPVELEPGKCEAREISIRVAYGNTVLRWAEIVCVNTPVEMVDHLLMRGSKTMHEAVAGDLQAEATKNETPSTQKNN